MPWVIGIDEAGYGPNLGPFVQAGVTLRLPADDRAGWQTLKSIIRRAAEQDDGRVVVDDSKAIYASGGPLDDLARGLQPFPHTIAEIVTAFALAEACDDITAEYWHTPEPNGAAMPTGSIEFGPRFVNLVAARRFNRIVDESGSKAVIVMRGFIALIQSILSRIDDDDPVLIFGDKHGGRHYYAPMLADAFPNGWVVSERETPDESRYRIESQGRPITIIMRPRADADCVSVALASMTAKYLRELCMTQFNAFWLRHVNNLQPTAGYPGDAKRFYREILPAMKKLNIEPDAVWRRK